jgi:Cu-Zn family superoxide dismutase
MRSRFTELAATLVLALPAAVLGGCASAESAAAPAADHAAMGHAAAPRSICSVATCNVTPTKGNTAHGWVRFEDVAGGVHVTAAIEGLSPGGTHAIHVHEFGDSSAPDGMSAGGHYNPQGHPHAGPDAPMHHAGDFGNLTADANGRATLDFVTNDLTVSGEHNPVLGRAIIVHAKPDDLATQPTGNAGGRIGCGVIGVAKPADAPK